MSSQKLKDMSPTCSNLSRSVYCKEYQYITSFTESVKNCMQDFYIYIFPNDDITIEGGTPALITLTIDLLSRKLLYFLINLILTLPCLIQPTKCAADSWTIWRSVPLSLSSSAWWLLIATLHAMLWSATGVKRSQRSLIALYQRTWVSKIPKTFVSISTVCYYIQLPSLLFSLNLSC